MSADQFWVPHPDLVFVPGFFVKLDGENNVYQIDGGENINVPVKNQLEQITDANVLSGVPDICTLDSVTEASLLHTVRARYCRDEIYTNISRICIAVNPFKGLNIYSNDVVDSYKQAKDPSQLPPHVFGIGADAFGHLVDDRKSQAVLISGESGAGKTESTKLVLLYISEVANSGEAGFEDKILEINPILEAFGNAKTVRNNNSSRFGKWIEISVNPTNMSIVGATVTDYLLEVTRVNAQGPNERNYHIFYQLFMDKTGDLDACKLDDASSFVYLNRNAAVVEAINDSEEFNALKKAFASLKFSVEEQSAIFKIVAGILHLGNVTFKADGDGAAPVDMGAVKTAAELFGCPEDVLKTCMCCKRLVVGKDVTVSPVDTIKAAQARDSIAKLIYGRLFKWLVVRCNKSLGFDGAPINTKDPFIGVLDIAGFESFETNMLEQLFINLSNEKLQQFFNGTVFKTELAEYGEEGIEVGTINFADNADVLSLIEGKGGLLPMLDDATTGVRQTDKTFTDAAIKAHEKNVRFIKPKFTGGTTFGIHHFAGDVQYTTEGFLEKNFASQPPEVVEMMEGSTLDVVKVLAEDPDGPPAAGGKAAKKKTVSSNFRSSLHNLIEKFQDAKAHFIRCVKPNMNKVPDVIDAPMTMDQLRLSGVMEAIKIRKAGFPLRQKCNEFIKRYLILLPLALRKKCCADVGSKKTVTMTEESDFKKACHLLMDYMPTLLGPKFAVTDFAIGKTKVFVRDSMQKVLEKYRRLAFAGPALQIQTAWRGYHVREMLKEVKEINHLLSKWLTDSGIESKGAILPATSIVEKMGRATVMEGSLLSLDLLIKQAQSLTVKLPVLQQIMAARARLKAESHLARLMQDLSGSFDVPGMQTVLGRSKDYNMKGELVDTLTKRCEALRKQMPHKRALANAAVNDELEPIQEAIAAAREAGFDNKENWLMINGFETYENAVKQEAFVIEEIKRKEEEAKRIEEEKIKAEEERKRKEEEAKKAAEEAARIQEEEARRAAEEAARKLEEERVAAEAEAKRKEEEAVAAAAAARIAEEERQVGLKVEAERKAKEIEDLKEKIRKAAVELDAEVLVEAFRTADELGLDHKEYAGAQQVQQDLQSGDFVQADLARLREAKGTSPLDMLQRSNLVKQIESLGLKVNPFSEDMRSVAGGILAGKGNRRSIFDSSDPTELKLAQLVFEDLSNFSGLCEPHAWGAKGGAAPLDNYTGKIIPMLRYSYDRIPEPMTIMEKSEEQAGVRSFEDLLRAMGDKPSAYIGDKEQPVIDTANRSPSLCDEVYVQLIKQLTANPSIESATKGWSLIAKLCSTALPSEELCEFVCAFLQKVERGLAELASGAMLKPDSDEKPSPRSRADSGRKSTRGKSIVAIAEQGGLGWAAKMDQFKMQQPGMASKALEAFRASLNKQKPLPRGRKSCPPVKLDKNAGGTAERAEGDSISVKVHAEDGTSRDIRAKPTLTLKLFHEKNQKALSLRSSDGFAFFLADEKPGAICWRMLPDDMTVAQANAEATERGKRLLYGRLNLAPQEDLHADDFKHAELSYRHAVVQYLQYVLPLNDEDADASIPEMAAAMIHTDMAMLRKDKDASAKFKAELATGIQAEGVLERYIPDVQLSRLSREAWAAKVNAIVKTAEAKSGMAEGEDDGSPILVTQSRSLSLMQVLLPNFEAYFWGPVQQVKLDSMPKWITEAENTSSLVRPPKKAPNTFFQLDEKNPDKQWRLLLTNFGLMFRTMQPELKGRKGVRMPFQRGSESQHLTGWQCVGDTLHLSVAAWVVSPDAPDLSQYTAQAIAIKIPDGNPQGITALLLDHSIANFKGVRTAK